MNRIKNTLFTFTGQLLLACAVALLTQQAAQGQTSVSVVNTPTVRIDSRANEVKVVNSPSTPVPVRVSEEPFQVLVTDTTGYSGTCFDIPIPQGRLAVIEHMAVANSYGSQVADVTLVVSYKLDQYSTHSERMYDVPLNEKGRGLLQLKLHVKREFIATGDVFAPQICYQNLKFPNGNSSIVAIVSGHLLPQ